MSAVVPAMFAALPVALARHTSHLVARADAHPIRFIIGLAVSGLIIGALGRLVVPGRQPLGCLGTILAGVAGSFLAGLIGRAIWGRTYVPGIIMSVLGAALVVWAVSGIGRRTVP